MGGGTSNLFEEQNKIELVFKYPNRHGAAIYHDSNGNYYYRCGDVPGMAPEFVGAYYNADCYVDLKGSQYRVVGDPDLVDEFGNIVVNEEEFDVAEKQPELPMTLFKTAIWVKRIFTDHLGDGLYRGQPELGSTFYKCMDPVLRELTEEKYLYIFEDRSKPGYPSLIVDKYERRSMEYRCQHLTQTL
ncbi:hypothetical protein GOP47_0020009 [Adiantum capillus-veneris]|uniref:Uncharacterized protein n=1 Tax=Adiantum capillus-veneris TaxID=13818 RepID=A0A9D4UC53_ADICA|nr:hypothetical protein GOP47_0020009 [Adiantum capillus-veneris]